MTKAKAKATRPVWELKVSSSNIERAAYNVDKEKLLIEFKSGSKYVYSDVSLDEFTEFTLSDSQGRWFLENIKDVKEFEKK